MNTVKEINKHARRLKALGYGLKHPYLLKKSIQHAVKLMYGEGVLNKGSLEKIALEKILNGKKEVKFFNYNVREGNVSFCELMIICSLIVSRDPKNILEIGTFDGNTTLQMALNASEEALIHTIDLPDGENETHLPILEEDMKFVHDKKKRLRKYVGTPFEKKIVQHFGDSTQYEFRKFGFVDFCFIDGGHSYECVRSDTEKALKVMSEKGVILWHDFDPNCPGVYNWLLDFSKDHQLHHFESTSLVIKLPHNEL